MNEIMKKIEAIFLQTLKVETLDANAELKDLGLDSLDLVEIMMELEQEFSIEFSNDEMMSFKTVGNVYESIEKKLEN